MKTLLKVAAIIFLLIVTFLGIHAAEGSNPSKVTIEGAGQPSVTRQADGSVSWRCDSTTSNPCTIIIEFNQ